jgi:uncharacterized tellurite resistance protein B-like protein
MLKRLAEMLEDWCPAPTVGPTPELAIVALLLEISRADHDIDPLERVKILAVTAEILGLTQAAAEDLLARAESRVELSISLDEFTDVVNGSVSLADKRRCLMAMWKVAYADGRIDRFEEYYLRKLSDLLHLSHSDFIQAKLAAERA